MATVLKTVVSKDTVGSNPTLIANGQVAEWSIAPDCKSGLNSTIVRIYPYPPNGSVAQLVEQKIEGLCVSGSNPLGSTK